MQSMTTKSSAPRRWTEARVVLIEKRTGGWRPLSWRAGARVATQALPQWSRCWADRRVMGGRKGGGIKDALHRRLVATQSGEHMYVSRNLSKSFDSVRISQLGAALQKLQAPQDLFNHVHALHNQHSPIFSVHGVVGQEWSQVKRGLAQGCPFSALLGAAVMMVWCCNIAQAGGDSVCFIDDRVTLNSSGKVLKETQTCPRSFDECFGFVCNPFTSRVASKPDNAEAAAVADRVTYRHRCRMRCIQWSGCSLGLKALHIKTLVLPMVTWAGNVRKFLMGRDSESVIGEWLSDWHSRAQQTIATCRPCDWILLLASAGALVAETRLEERLFDKAGIASGRCIDGISRQPEVADDLRGVLLLSLAFMESLTIYGLVI
ncbi:ATP synthase subunit c, chloroplastic, partial [Symbiodinium microadriaticum]